MTIIYPAQIKRVASLIRQYNPKPWAGCDIEACIVDHIKQVVEEIRPKTLSSGTGGYEIYFMRDCEGLVCAARVYFTMASDENEEATI